MKQISSKQPWTYENISPWNNWPLKNDLDESKCATLAWNLQNAVLSIFWNHFDMKPIEKLLFTTWWNCSFRPNNVQLLCHQTSIEPSNEPSKPARHRAAYVKRCWSEAQSSRTFGSHSCWSDRKWIKIRRISKFGVIANFYFISRKIFHRKWVKVWRFDW